MAEQPEPSGPSGPSAQPASAAERARALLPAFLPSLGVKVGILIAFTAMVIVSFIIYVLFARGVFDQTQRVYLITDNAEGIGVGTDLNFAGFPIGRVRRITLRDDGKVRISVRVPVEDTKWLRTTSVFVIDVPLVGAAKLRVYSANLQDPLLPDRSERPVLRGDTAQEIPKMVASMRSVLENLDQMSDAGSSLQQSLANVRAATDRMAGKYGLLGGALGSDENAQKLVSAIDRANALLATLEGASRKLDSVLSKTDERVFGKEGLADDAKTALAQANAVLGEVRASLKRVDGILADAQVAAGNVKVASADLGALRAEVDASLRKVAALIDEINRKWPFERDTRIKLP
jgi:phospholipid/cholesterol/gamma-HCH transport system substrate-binding protein